MTDGQWDEKQIACGLHSSSARRRITPLSLPPVDQIRVCNKLPSTA
jgi:hypothetical protein